MDFCVCCGAYVPEGYMVCLKCRMENLDSDNIETEGWEEEMESRINHIILNGD